MNIDRRKFLKSVGNAAAFSIVSSSSLRYFPFGQDETSSRKPRVAVFFDPTFPPVGEISLDENILGSALSWCATTYLNASDLKNKLSYQNFDLFINPYGSAFPKEAFAVID